MDDSYELTSNPDDMAKEPSSSNYSQKQFDRDRIELAYLGKKQVLKRSFGFLSMLGFSCTLMETWEGLLFSAVEGLGNGGSAGLIYGYIICWIGITCVLACLAEMASMAPTAGGQYHWVAMLAPIKSQKSLSYIAGWFTVAAWQAALASGLFSGASLLQGMLVLNGTTSSVVRWQETLLCFALLFLAVFINTVVSRFLAKLEGLLLVIHVLGVFAIIIPLIYLAPHKTASEVFGTFVNEGGWSSQGLSFMVGMNTAAFAFCGADGVAHMSEETENAARIVPWSIVSTATINGVLGFCVLLAIIFCQGNLENALTTPAGYPFIEIFAAAAGLPGANVMLSIVLTLAVFSNLALLATASRQMWAFARDNGLPGSKYLKQVDPKSSLPLYAIGLTTVIGVLIPLINIASTTAFAAICSLAVSSFYASFALPCYLLLWRRLSGDIARSSVAPNAMKNTPTARNLEWGPWRMPPRIGVLVNLVACAYTTIVIVFSFWPQETPVTPLTMNYAIVMSGAMMVIAVLFYLLRGKGEYVGPVVEISFIEGDNRE